MFSMQKQLPRKRYLLLYTFWKLKGNTCTCTLKRCNVMAKQGKRVCEIRRNESVRHSIIGQKCPIIKYTGVYTGNQFEIYLRRYRENATCKWSVRNMRINGLSTLIFIRKSLLWMAAGVSCAISSLIFIQYWLLRRRYSYIELNILRLNRP